MDFKELDRGEAVATLGGILLLLSIFLTWFTLGNQFTHLSSCSGPQHGGGATSCSGWAALSIKDLLILASLAPAILAYIIVRGHALSWPRGELTAVTALAALTLIIFRGLIDPPGSPSGEINLGYGWFVALLGGLLILVGSITRSRESTSRRKPPGVL
jgi:hypothetical protein